MPGIILVVEDSPVQQQMIRNMLNLRGYEVITAASGDEALEKVRRDNPALIVLDVNLPGKNGYHVCRMLKTSPNTQMLPVIMLTIRDSPSDRFWGMKQGADAYLSKPCDEDELLEAVARYL